MLICKTEAIILHSIFPYHSRIRQQSNRNLRQITKLPLVNPKGVIIMVNYSQMPLKQKDNLCRSKRRAVRQYRNRDNF